MDRSEHPDHERLGAWHDGELERAEAGAVREHVESCSLCRSAIDEMVRIDAAAGLLQPEVPGEAFWAKLETRIMNEIRTEDPEAGEAPSKAPGFVPGQPVRRKSRSSWWGTLIGRGGVPSLPWAVATAAGLVVIVLSSRVILNQLSPAETVQERAQVYDNAPPAGQSEARGPGEAGSPTETMGRVNGAPDLPQETQALDAPLTAAVPRAVAKQATRDETSGTRESDAAGGAPAANAGGLGEREAVVPSEAPATTGPPSAGQSVAAKEEAQDADEPRTAILMKTDALEQTKPAISSRGDGPPAPTTASTPNASMLSMSESTGPLNQALGYAAEVESALRRRDESTDRRVVEPGTLEEKFSEAARRRAARNKPRSEDYEIAYAAAFRALEAGQLDLARRGFRIVAQGIPESELARDADFNEKLMQFRIMERDGVDPEVILHQASERAEQAWDQAQNRKSPVTCREALALERVRLVLLKEIRPAADVESFRERLVLLRACS